MSDRHSMRGLTRPLVIIDSEWSSGAPESARLVQLCLRRLEPGGEQTQRTWLIDPECAIEPGAEAVHGITAAALAEAGAPPFREIAADVAGMLGGADIGGFAISGDIAIIERELGQCGRVWYPERLAIVDGLRILQAREPRRLVDVYKHVAGGDPEALPAHDAAADVEMAAAVIARQAEVDRLTDCPQCEGAGRIDAETEPPSEGDCPACGGYGTTIEPGTLPSARDLHNESLPGQLDPGGKFRRRPDDGVIVFGFGQHRLLPVAEHPDYLAWMLSKDFAPSTLRIAAKLLQEGAWT